MAILALLKRNTYYDSITLMSVAQAAKDLGIDPNKSHPTLVI